MIARDSGVALPKVRKSYIRIVLVRSGLLTECDVAANQHAEVAVPGCAVLQLHLAQQFCAFTSKRRKDRARCGRHRRSDTARPLAPDVDAAGGESRRQ